MSFLENIRRKEQEKRRASAWSQAVGQLSRFVRHYLRLAEKGSGLLVTPDLLRVDNLLLDRLTLFFEGETVTATPLPLSDPRAGRAVASGSTRPTGLPTACYGTGLLPRFRNIGRSFESKILLARTEYPTKPSIGDGFDKLEPLSERSLDQALGSLFGSASVGKPASSEPSSLHRRRQTCRFVRVDGQAIENSRYLRAGSGELPSRVRRIPDDRHRRSASVLAHHTRELSPAGECV